MTTTATTTATATTTRSRSSKQAQTPATTTTTTTAGAGGGSATLPQAALKRALKIVGTAVADRSTLPVLSHTLISIGDEALVLQATNLEIGLRLRVPAQVTSPASITVPARLLTDIVGTLGHGEIGLSIDSRRGETTLTCGGFVTSLKGFEAEEFPSLPGAAGTEPLATLPATTLRAALAQVVFAAASDQSRPVLTGVRLTLDGATLTLDAADGLRLARKTVDLGTAVGRTEAIVPADTLKRLGALLAEVEGDVGIVVSPNGNQVVFTGPSLEVVMRTIDGTYPDVARVIPATRKTTIEAETGAMLQALKLAALFAADQVLRLTAQRGPTGMGSLGLESTAQVGQHHSVVAATVQGDTITMGVNVSYLQEAIAALGSAQARMELQSPQAPIVVKPHGDGSYTHIVMPILIK